MSASNYLEAKLLDHSLGVAAYPMPTVLFMGLHTANPGEDGAIGEVAGGSYARQPITFGANPVGAPSVNNLAATFPSMPAVTVTHFVIRDAFTSGNPLYIGALVTPLVLLAGQPAVFTVGQVAVGAD